MELLLLGNWTAVGITNGVLINVFGSTGLSVCGQHYSKRYEWIGTKCYGGVLGSTMNNRLNLGGDLDL